MKNRSNNTFLKWTPIFIALIVFRACLDYAFKTVLYIYSNSLIQSGINTRNSLASWACYIPLVALISYANYRKRNTSYIVLVLLFLINGAGYYTYYANTTVFPIEYFVLINVFWWILALYILYARSGDVSQNMSHPNAVSMGTSEFVIWLMICLIAFVLSGIYGGFRFTLSFDNVYQYRFQVQMPTIVAFVFRFVSGVFLPYFFTRFITMKKNVFAIITFLFAVLMFSIDGLKTNLVLYAVIIAIFLIYSWFEKRQVDKTYSVAVIALLLALFIMLNCVLYVSTGKDYFLSESYRCFIVPCGISKNYFLFIKENEPLLLRQSILRYFFDSPYSESINYLVTDQVTKYGRAVANTGLIGDAYANFKVVGVVIYPFLYGYVLKKWQKLNKDFNSILSVALGFILFWNAINLSFFTWLLTGGVIAMFACVYFFITKRAKVNLGRNVIRMKDFE